MSKPKAKPPRPSAADRIIRYADRLMAPLVKSKELAEATKARGLENSKAAKALARRLRQLVRFNFPPDDDDDDDPYGTYPNGIDPLTCP
jgi:hypothetical protein